MEMYLVRRGSMNKSLYRYIKTKSIYDLISRLTKRHNIEEKLYESGTFNFAPDECPEIHKRTKFINKLQVRYRPCKNNMFWVISDIENSISKKMIDKPKNKLKYD